MAKRAPEPEPKPTEQELIAAERRTQMEDVARAAVEANLEVASAAPRGAGLPIDASAFRFLGSTGGGFEDKNRSKVRKMMKEADDAYRSVGIIRNVIDIMTDFASEGLNIIHPVKSQERFYQAWLKKVDMDSIAKQILQGMYIWGNVGVFRFWGKIRPKTKTEMMAKAKELFAQGRDREAVRAFFREETLSIKNSKIPVRYTCIPPFDVRIVGSILFPTRYYYYQLSQYDLEKLTNPSNAASAAERRLMDGLSPDMLKQIQKDNGLVELPAENFVFFQYKKDCSRLWADPMIRPIMDDLRYKQVLRRMDVSVAESIINPITVYKLGKTVEGYPPTPDMFSYFANLMKTPVATKNLIWSDLIEIEQKTIDSKEVFDTEKYKQVNDDILAGLGISQVLINGGAGGGGGGFSNAFLSVRTLLERLEDGRSEVLKFLEQELEYIRRAMGWKKAPIVTWDQMNLRDEAAEKRIIIELLDRKVISSETALDMLGYNYDIELNRKLRETKVSEKNGVVHSVGPFEEAVRVQKDADPAAKNVEISREGMKNDVEIKRKQLENKQSGPSAGPGRPSNQGDPQSRRQTVKRETKPKGMGSIREDFVELASANRQVIENYLKPLFLKAYEKDNLRQLTAAEKKEYLTMIEAVLSNAKPSNDVQPGWVKSISEKIAAGELAKNMKVDIIYKQLIADHGKPASEADSKDLYNRAWALLHS